MLALLMVFYTLPVLKVILFDVGLLSGDRPGVFSIELIYGLGPSLYLYTRLCSDPQDRLRTVDALHFFPVILEFGYYLSGSYKSVDRHVIGPVRSDDHLAWMIQQAGGAMSILVYLAITMRRLHSFSNWVKTQYSDWSRKTLQWLQKPVFFYSAFFLMWLILRVVDILIYGDGLDLAVYYPLLCLLSFTTYWIGTQGFCDRA